MSHRVRSHLRLAVEEYDAAIRRFIPGYEEMLRVAAAAVAERRPGRVLDLGAGTGALSEAVLAHPGVGEVVLLDVDPEMLAQARARLGRHGERVRFAEASFEDPLPAADAVVASLSLHHVPTLTAKEALFRRIRDALPEGGPFVNADVTVPAAGPARDATYRTWADHLVASGIAEEDAWRHFEEWSEEDTYFPLEDELAALGRAGFHAEAVWRDEPSTVVVGRRGQVAAPPATLRRG